MSSHSLRRNYNDPKTVQTKHLRTRRPIYDVDHQKLIEFGQMAYKGVRGHKPKFRYGPGLMGNYLSHSGDHVVRSYARRKRAPKKFGTKVRRAALKLSESKRLTNSLEINASLASLTMFRHEVFQRLRHARTQAANSEEGHALIAERFMQGAHCFIRGAKIDIRITNLSTTNPTDVRVFCGWRKGNQVRQSDGLKNSLAIFKDSRDKEGSRQLNETDAVSRGVLWRAIYTPIDKSDFHLEKEFKLRLGPSQSTEDHAGDDFKILKWWWEMQNKKLSTNSTIDSTGTDLQWEKACSFYPVVYVYHASPTVGGTGNIFYEISSQLYWRDP